MSNSTDSTTPSRGVFSNISYDQPLDARQMVEWLQQLSQNGLCRASGVMYGRLPSGLLVPIESDSALFAWIDSYATVRWSRSGLPKSSFYEAVHWHLPDHEWATDGPHYPPLPNVLYHGTTPAPRATGLLDEFVRRFSPETPLDAQLIQLCCVTPAAGLPHGKRPLFVFEAEAVVGDPDFGRGRGKTTAAEMIARLFGGSISFLSSASPDATITSLLSPAALPLRIALIDNLKSRRLSSEFLERLITAHEINGRRLYAGFGRRPNVLTFMATVNGAAFSKDLAKRAVVIRLGRAEYSSDWWEETNRFVTERRADLLSDIGHFLTRERRPLRRQLRWDVWGRDVVGRLADPDPVVALIHQRQGQIDADDVSADDLVDHLEMRIRERAGPGVQNRAFYLPSGEVGVWVHQLGGPFAGGNTTTLLKHLAHPRLVYHRTSRERGWVWRGSEHPENGPIEALPPATNR